MKPLMALTILGLAVVVGFLINWKGCNSGTATGIQADTIKVKKKDSIVYRLIHDTVNRPYYVPKYKYIERLIPANVDTAAILADYHNMRVYNDTLTNDSNLTYTSTDSVTHNRITSRKPKYILHTKEKTVYSTTETTITKHDVSHHYYYGLCSSFNAKHYGLTSIVGGPQIGMGFMIGTTYNKANISVSYDVLRERVGFNYLIKIR